MIAGRQIGSKALRDLIDHLSPAAAFWRSLSPDAVWDLPAMLLAEMVDELHRLRWRFEQAYFKGSHPRPKPVPRPGIGARDAGTETTVIGDGTGFDTFADFDAWYAAVSPTGRSRAAGGS